MKTYKGKIINPGLEKTINELNHNIKLLKPGEWANPRTKVSKDLKERIVKLQKNVDAKLKSCPDYPVPVDVHGMTASQILEMVKFARLKAKGHGRS